MRVVLTLAAFAACSAIAAERVVSNGTDEVRIFDSPCVHAGVLAMIPPSGRERFKKATARLGGQMYYACWTEIDGQARLLYEDGDRGSIPMDLFKAQPEV